MVALQDRLRIFKQYCTDTIWQKQSFMRVYGDRLATLDAFQKWFALVQQIKKSTIGCIYLKPDIMLIAQVGDGFQRIDGPVVPAEAMTINGVNPAWRSDRIRLFKAVISILY